MTTITDLPMELVEEIVSRVPLTSMITVGLTCKKWNSLSKSESFKKIHIRKALTTREGDFQMILWKDYNLYLVGVFVNDLTTKFLGQLTFLDEQVKITEVYNCEGLLLCILENDRTEVVAWNPYLGQTRWIETRYSHRPYGMCMFSYALGYDDHSHKLLRFLDNCYPRIPENRFFLFEIYDFESGLWTTLDFNPYWRITGYHMVSLKGNTYWLASQRDSEYDENTHIICFDFTSERFGPLLPLPFDVEVDEYVVNLSCGKEEKLVVLLHYERDVNPYEHEIWITTKIEAENVSWSKFLTLNSEPVHLPISPSRNFFIDEEKKVAMGFHNYGSSDRCTLSIVGEAGYFKKMDLGKHALKGLPANAYSYVPSLAQIEESAGGKRKQQSDLEKHRFDEKMSRLDTLQLE